MDHPIHIFWFRRDLRLKDNAGLYEALRSGKEVLPLFIFDETILSKLEDKKDLRVNFIHHEILQLSNELKALGSGLLVRYGNPENIFQDLFKQHVIEAVYCNHDYEPEAIARDNRIQNLTENANKKFFSFKDHCIFEKDEITKDDGKPYTVFTPYARKWKAKLHTGIRGNENFYLKPYPSEKYFHRLIQHFAFEPIPHLQQIGFESDLFAFPDKNIQTELVRNYKQFRDFPALNRTSHAGIHFRFGTISIREKAATAYACSETFLNELIWRDFYMQILWHFPYVSKGAFKKQYDRILWRNNEADFHNWCEGKTGFPIVDAGMRELNQSGFMHNRVRMITASFLCKHLLIDWRWGEAYFAKKLLDFDLSANNGGWQWAAGCGTDAAPYFRIFNPELQTKKFDSDLMYIKKWIPEFGTAAYPKPMVDHAFARNRCLQTYQKALRENG